MSRFTRIACLILALSLLTGLMVGWLETGLLRDVMASSDYTAPAIDAPHNVYTALTVTDISRSGITATLTSAAAAGNKFANNGKVFIDISNGYTGAITATFITGRTVDDLAVADLTVQIASGAEKFIGPFEPGTFNDSDGYVNIDFTTVTTVTIGAFRLQ